MTVNNQPCFHVWDKAGTYYKVILVSHVQDKVPTGSYTTIRDASLQQIIYGDGQGTTGSVTDVAGTVDFLYHGQNSFSSQSGDSSRQVTWVAAYGNDYNCEYAPPTNTDYATLSNACRSTSYSYDTSGISTVQVTLPLHTGSYTSTIQHHPALQCPCPARHHQLPDLQR